MARVTITLPTDQNGQIISDTLSAYQVSNGPTESEQADDILYYLGIAPDGSWYIRKRTLSLGIERFCRGADDYLTAWTNKASQTYDYFDKIF